MKIIYHRYYELYHLTLSKVRINVNPIGSSNVYMQSWLVKQILFLECLTKVYFSHRYWHWYSTHFCYFLRKKIYSDSTIKVCILLIKLNIFFLFIKIIDVGGNEDTEHMIYKV